MVLDPPVRRYGGLKDQDCTFTDTHCNRDHSIKGATGVSFACTCCAHEMTNAPTRALVSC